jgi:hypothetical protein
MPKTIYTEHDIDDMKARGVTSIDVTESVILTDLALERTLKHGIKINRIGGLTSPKATYSPSVNTYTYSQEISSDSGLKQKIKAAVLARLNGRVEETVLDATILRLMESMK